MELVAVDVSGSVAVKIVETLPPLLDVLPQAVELTNVDGAVSVVNRVVRKLVLISFEIYSSLLSNTSYI